MPPDRTLIPLAGELDRLTTGERLAVWAFRCSVHGQRACGGSAGGGSAGKAWPRGTNDLPIALASLSFAHEQMLKRQGAGLRVAAPGTVALMPDECRLLQATAAAVHTADVLDDCLLELAPSRMVRPYLAKALTELGAALGTLGYWLPVPPRGWALPAAALSLARKYGTSLAEVEVAWPLGHWPTANARRRR